LKKVGPPKEIAASLTILVKDFEMIEGLLNHRKPVLSILMCGLLSLLGNLAHAVDVPTLSMAEAAKRLSAGGYVLMMRHGDTDAGQGDPPEFKLNDCKTQRNLSAEGKAQLKRVAEAFKASGIRVDEVASSEWCRCKETADIVFGQHTTWPALNSFFSNIKRSEAQQTAELKSVLPYLKAPKNSVWVTHQVNITALTGFVPNAAEILAVRWGKPGSSAKEPTVENNVKLTPDKGGKATSSKPTETKASGGTAVAEFRFAPIN
jgi:phosphohistidine phosphatase SixA